MNIIQVKESIIEICKYKHAANILKKVNGKRNYSEIAETLKIHPTTSSHILKKAETFGLLKKNSEGLYQKSDEFKHLDIARILRESDSEFEKETKVSIRKRKKITDYEQIKRIVTDYIYNHFEKIPHPFNDDFLKLNKSQLDKALEVLFKVLEADCSEKLTGLHDKFFDAFSTYFSAYRINKTEFTNSFSVLIKCFEPFVKKLAAIKSGDPTQADKSLSKELIKQVITFDSNIDKKNSDYWKDKPIHEASLRVIYPYRHIEAHEAREYTLFQMERITYYMFASIIFMNMDKG